MLDLTPFQVAAVAIGALGLIFTGFFWHTGINMARISLYLDDITMYQTHIGHLETQRYAALPVVRQLLNRLADNNDGKLTAHIEDLMVSLEQYILAPTHYRDTQGAVQIPDLAILRMLADIWQRQTESYPDTEEGLWTTAAVGLCAQELLAILDDDKDFVPTSMRASVQALRETRS